MSKLMNFVLFNNSVISIVDQSDNAGKILKFSLRAYQGAQSFNITLLLMWV